MNTKTHEILPWDQVPPSERRSALWKKIEPDVPPIDRKAALQAKLDDLEQRSRAAGQETLEAPP